MEVARKPAILSHAVLDTGWARSVCAAHARLVASRGGVIGIFPVNSGYQGFTGPSSAATLLARGYSRGDVATVMGGNFLRVYREVAAV
jgi:microsomal dipeptidase-like Zn-dependent dipeptidase